MWRLWLLIAFGVLILGQVGWGVLGNGTLAAAEAQTTVPVATPSILLQGRFHGVAHHGHGVATIYELSGGNRVLRLTDFETTKGPDLYVYLVAASDAQDHATVRQAGFISLGRLQSHRGNQEYSLPANVDLTKYRSVSVWCRDFGVNFATAPLRPRSN